MTRLHTTAAPAGVLLVLVSFAPVSAQQTAPPFRYETQHADDYFTRRAAALAAALGFAGWPRSAELYAAPAIGRTLFRDPAIVADEVRACTTVPFGDEAWPQCTWSWKGLAERREKTSQDWLDLQVTVAPGSRAAQEHLLTSMIDNMLPTEAMVARYKDAERPENLGDVGFVVRNPKGYESTVLFLRANLVFRIRGHGALAAEAISLAARLDERLVNQSSLTLEDLRTRSRAPLPRR
jgi:hypothetical protein